MLKVEGLEKSFGGNKVLKGVDFELKEGEITVIVGPSGGGKTTFLRCISGLTNPDNGSIIINNKYLYKAGKMAKKNWRTRNKKRYWLSISKL